MCLVQNQSRLFNDKSIDFLYLFALSESFHIQLCVIKGEYVMYRQCKA